MRLFTAIAVLSLLAGCSSQQLSSMQRQLRAEQDRNFELQQRLDGQVDQVERAAPTETTAPVPSPAATPAVEPEAPAPAPAPVAAPAPVQAPARVPVVVAPPRAPIPVMHGTAPGQCGGVFTMEIQNRTEYFLRVHARPAAGRSVAPQGGTIRIAPRDSFTVCLRTLGRYSIRGIAYAPNGRQMVQVNRFQITRAFSTRSMSTLGRQVIRVNSDMLNFH